MLILQVAELKKDLPPVDRAKRMTTQTLTEISLEDLPGGKSRQPWPLTTNGQYGRLAWWPYDDSGPQVITGNKK